MSKWLVAYTEEKFEETLYFSRADSYIVPVWAAHGVFVADDGMVIKSGVTPVHLSREGAEMLSFNCVTFDKKYMGRVTAVECPFRDCGECATS